MLEVFFELTLNSIGVHGGLFSFESQSINLLKCEELLEKRNELSSHFQFQAKLFERFELELIFQIDIAFLSLISTPVRENSFHIFKYQNAEGNKFIRCPEFHTVLLTKSLPTIVVFRFILIPSSHFLM